MDDGVSAARHNMDEQVRFGPSEVKFPQPPFDDVPGEHDDSCFPLVIYTMLQSSRA
jgi:hypothetical protein